MEYEGEYLYDKKWNSKGYDGNGDIIYELIKGNGKVKEYDAYDKLRFEGEYINGKLNGKGKEYNNDRLIFEGEYLNGERHGKGKEYDNYDFKNYLKFEGEYLNGKRNGKGIEYQSDGDLIFEGEYLDGKIWNGKGKGEYGFNSMFKGEYLNGKEWNGVIKTSFCCGDGYCETKIINGKSISK